MHSVVQRPGQFCLKDWTLSQVVLVRCTLVIKFITNYSHHTQVQNMKDKRFTEFTEMQNHRLHGSASTVLTATAWR